MKTDYKPTLSMTQKVESAHNFRIVEFGKSFPLFQGNKNLGLGVVAKMKTEIVGDVM